jgi:hypothetical protein
MIAFALDVEWGKLGEATAASAVIGLGVLVLAAVAVASSLRAADARTGGGSTASFGAVTIACVVALVAIVGYGIYTIAS